jgi:hypothetical protein
MMRYRFVDALSRWVPRHGSVSRRRRGHLELLRLARAIGFTD